MESHLFQDSPIKRDPGQVRRNDKKQALFIGQGIVYNFTNSIRMMVLNVEIKHGTASDE